MGIVINLNIKYKDYLKKKLEHNLQMYQGHHDDENIQAMMTEAIKNIIGKITKKFKLKTFPSCIVKVISSEDNIIQKITVEFKELSNEWLANCCED